MEYEEQVNVKLGDYVWIDSPSVFVYEAPKLFKIIRIPRFVDSFDLEFVQQGQVATITMEWPEFRDFHRKASKIEVLLYYG